MCGSLQLSATEKLMVSSGILVKKDIISPRPKYDIGFSSHRFVRYERKEWWSKKTAIIEVTLAITGIYEKNKYFIIPKDYKVCAWIHKEIIDWSNKWVISIVTVDSNTYNDLNNISFYRDISRIHNRVPLLKIA